MLKSLELTHHDQKRLKNYCKLKIDFISTPYDIDSAKFLSKIGLNILRLRPLISLI